MLIWDLPLDILKKILNGWCTIKFSTGVGGGNKTILFRCYVFIEPFHLKLIIITHITHCIVVAYCAGNFQIFLLLPCPQFIFFSGGYQKLGGNQIFYTTPSQFLNFFQGLYQILYLCTYNENP